MSLVSIPDEPTRTAEATAEYTDAMPVSGQWDWWLVGTATILAGFGLLMILSASSARADAEYGNALHFVSRQSLALTGGVVGAGLLMKMPWTWLRKGAWPVYLLSLVALGLVMTPLGHAANGAARWIALGGVNIQPSEFVKITLVVVLAHYLAANEGRMGDIVGTVSPVAGVAAPAILLVLLQPDFGTTVILCGLAGTLLFIAGLRWTWVGGLGLSGGAILTVVAVIAPYRLRRITSFTDPFADPDGAGYQVVQGWIAMAHGGWSGQGLGTGVAQMGFLPEAHNDFIAAIVGEELGAIGWILLVGAQALIVWRGTVIASKAPDLFGTLVASAITVLLGAQAIVNLGVVTGLLPNKGLVLPFLSYGSSAAMVHTLCVGLLLRISLEGRGR